jgi:hypothetical protein
VERRRVSFGCGAFIRRTGLVEATLLLVIIACMVAMHFGL